MQKCATETRKWHVEYFAVDITDFNHLSILLKYGGMNTRCFTLGGLKVSLYSKINAERDNLRIRKEKEGNMRASTIKF